LTSAAGWFSLACFLFQEEHKKIDITAYVCEAEWEKRHSALSLTKKTKIIYIKKDGEHLDAKTDNRQTPSTLHSLPLRCGDP